MSNAETSRPEHKMGTRQRSKYRKMAKAARRRWTVKRKAGDSPSRELRRSW